jgi:electron transport complex protein RnfG
MKKIFITLLLMAAFVTADAQQVMRKEKDGTYVVNTTTLATDVEGYAGPTPVEVYIKKNKIVKVVLLKSMETPKYNAKVKKQMIPLYENVKLKKGKKVEVDGVTGATFTSEAVKENVQRGLDYYWKHK